MEAEKKDQGVTPLSFLTHLKVDDHPLVDTGANSDQLPSSELSFSFLHLGLLFLAVAGGKETGRCMESGVESR